MSRTYHASFDKRVRLMRDSWINDDGAWVVWADPERLATGRSLGGPFVLLVGFWDPQEQLAKRIAELLTEHSASLDDLPEAPQ